MALDSRLSNPSVNRTPGKLRFARVPVPFGLRPPVGSYLTRYARAKCSAASRRAWMKLSLSGLGVWAG